MMWSTFDILIFHLYIFGDMSLKLQAHFLNKLSVFLSLNFKSSLYILVNGYIICNIFSQSVAGLLILLILSFTEKKFLILVLTD